MFYWHLIFYEYISFNLYFSMEQEYSINIWSSGLKWAINNFNSIIEEGLVKSSLEKQSLVTQANDLIEASYKIWSIEEARLVRMLISQIRPDDEDFKTYRISIIDFANLFNISWNNIYDHVKRAADNLVSRRILIENDDGSWMRMNWLSYARYKKGTWCVEMRFDKELKPYLLQLKWHFTQYSLDKILHFRSTYTMRLFELLKTEEFKAKTWWYFKKSFEYDEIREKLWITKDEYRLFADFRINVIEVAVKEMNANPDLHISQVDYPKTWRKISHVVFHCEKAKQTQLSIEEVSISEVEKKTPEYIKEITILWITEEVAHRLVRKYKVQKIQQTLWYTKAMRDKWKIKDTTAGFFITALQNDMAVSWIDTEKKKQQKIIEKRMTEDANNEMDSINKLEAQKKREVILWKFHSLSEENQSRIRDMYEWSISAFPLSSWTKAKNKSETPENDPTVKVEFAKFLSDNQNLLND